VANRGIGQALVAEALARRRENGYMPLTASPRDPLGTGRVTPVNLDVHRRRRRFSERSMKSNRSTFSSTTPGWRSYDDLSESFRARNDPPRRQTSSARTKRPRRAFPPAADSFPREPSSNNLSMNAFSPLAAHPVPTRSPKRGRGSPDAIAWARPPRRTRRARPCRADRACGPPI